MFIFDISFAKLFYAFEIIFRYLVNGNRFIIKVFILQLRIRKVEFIKIYCLFKVTSVYQLRGFDYFCIVSLFKVAMLMSDLWASTEVISRLNSFLQKHCLFYTTSFKYKKIFLSACHTKYTFSLLEYHGLMVFVIQDA